MMTLGQAKIRENTWALFGDKYPDFWSKGTAFCTADPDSMFPEGRYLKEEEKGATKVCNGCPYVIECLQFAIENDEWGIWGGTTRDERKSMRKRMGYE